MFLVWVWKKVRAQSLRSVSYPYGRTHPPCGDTTAAAVIYDYRPVCEGTRVQSEPHKDSESWEKLEVISEHVWRFGPCCWYQEQLNWQMHHLNETEVPCKYAKKKTLEETPFKWISTCYPNEAKCYSCSCSADKFSLHNQTFFFKKKSSRCPKKPNMYIILTH